jgi:hypothetical protein
MLYNEKHQTIHAYKYNENYLLLNIIMSYGLFLWGNSPHSLKMFRMQKKKKIKIMAGCNNRASFRNLFRKLEILLLASQHIFSLMLFVVNKNLFVLNPDKHNIRQI